MPGHGQQALPHQRSDSSQSLVQTEFRPSRHGFPFPNSFPAGSPVLNIPTPWGILPVGDAGGGLCGGMVFAALDLYHAGQTPPAAVSPELFRYFCQRLLASFDLPFGVWRYYDWQRRARGVITRTLKFEWPRIRAELVAGRPVPLGIVQSQSWNPWKLARHHQVLAWAYEQPGPGQPVQLRIYDPNYPSDDDITLTAPLDTTSQVHFRHSIEGETIRGIFRTRYRTPPKRFSLDPQVPPR